MSDRGKILDIELGKEIFFNEKSYTAARVEIDHINFGLCPKSKKLNFKRRSDFSTTDVICFLTLLDGIDLMPKKIAEGLSFFAIEMACPIEGSEFGKKYRLVFTTSEDEVGIIGTITLYRVK